MWPFKKKREVLARKAGIVTLVQTGLVVVGDRRYTGLRATFVQPGQKVKKNQPLGKL